MKSSWETKRLRDLPVLFVDGDRSGRYPKRSEFVSEGILFLNAESITNGFVNLDAANFIAPEKFSTIKKGRLQRGDVLVTMRGNGVGKVAFFAGIPPTGLINAQMLIVRSTSDSLNPLFLYYLILTPFYFERLRGLATGSAQPQLSIASLRELEISIPQSEEQNKIASILSAYDDLFANNSRRIKILQEMAKTIYDEWFVKFHFPGHEKVKMVESELGMLPEGWEVTVLEGTCNRITDGSHSSPKSVEEGLPMASVKDMHDWGFEIENCRKISIEDFNGLVRNDCKPLKGDVLIAKDGSYLKHVFAIEKELNLVILSSIAILRPNERVLPYYLAFYLRDPKVKDRLKGYVSGVALPRIILKDFRKFKCVLPPIEIQKAWVDIINPMVKNCWRMVDKNKNLRQTRDLLLPKLISGEIDVENLDIKTEE